MNELLLFVVLLSPFLVPLSITIVGLLITWTVVRKLSDKGSKRRTWIIGIILIILIPTWDVILGRAYYHSLCAIQSGPKIYKQVELPAEYWEEVNGTNFLDDYIFGNSDRVTLEIDDDFHKNYKFKSKLIKLHPHFLHIKKKLRSVTETRSGVLLGTYTTYFISSGWLISNTFIGGPSGTHCPQKGYEHFIRDIFVPTTMTHNQSLNSTPKGGAN